MPDPLGNPEVSARPEGHIARLEILSAVHRSRWLRASNSGAASKSSSSIGKLGHPRNVFFTSIPTFWGIWGSVGGFRSGGLAALAGVLPHTPCPRTSADVS